MKGVIGGDTQASQVSSFVGSSLNFDLENRFYRILIKIFYKYQAQHSFCCLDKDCRD